MPRITSISPRQNSIRLEGKLTPPMWILTSSKTLLQFSTLPVGREIGITTAQGPLRFRRLTADPEINERVAPESNKTHNGKSLT